MTVDPTVAARSRRSAASIYERFSTPPRPSRSAPTRHCEISLVDRNAFTRRPFAGTLTLLAKGNGHTC